jgi:hypothetical protein
MDQSNGALNMAVVEGRQNMVVAVSIAMTIIASNTDASSNSIIMILTFSALAVGLRIFTRSMIVGRMYLDDWAMVATMVFAYAFLLELAISIKTFNAGYSGAQLNLDEMTGILKVS